MKGVIVVAGGAGFIGSNLCALLIKNKKNVLCIDNLKTGNKKNITAFLSSPNFKFVNQDIASKSLLAIFKNLKVDEIYNLASPASVDYVTAHPVETALTNSLGLKNLLDIARNSRARLLFASSSEVYGDPKTHPQKEDYWGNVNSIGIRSAYDEGKRFGEALCMAYSREFGVAVGIARIFNTYGPNSGLTDGRIIPRFITQALLGKDLTVHGKGIQTRSFCYVGDMVLGLVNLMNINETGPFNLGNPDEYKIIDVARKIIKLTGSNSKIIYTERPKDDPSVRKPDISKARLKLHWKPKISFEEGLTGTIRYYKHELNEK